MVEPGTILQNRYRVERLIGRGGMGAVYEAVDERLGHRVALKETLVTDEPLRRAFEREARTLAGLHHPVLPGVSDHFVEAEGQYLVMRFIPGDDLGEALARQGGPYPVAQVLAWGERLLDALDYLHSHQPPIVHRDIKPQNLKVTARGEIILLDFGLAKGGDIGVTETLTARSVYGYTPRYAPPEQIQGVGTEPRSDLYALGATLYHLVTGVKPADARERAAAAFNRLPDPLRPAHEVAPTVPLGLSALLGQALALAVEERPPSAATMRQQIGRLTRALALAEEPAPVTRTLPPLTALTNPTPSLYARSEAPTRLVAAVESSAPPQTPPEPRSPNQLGLFVTTTMGLLLVLGLLSLGVWWAIGQLGATAAPEPTEPAIVLIPSPTATLPLPPVATETLPAPVVLTATQTLMTTATLTLTATLTSAPLTPTLAPSATPRPPSPTRVPPSATTVPPSATPTPSATLTPPPTETPLPPTPTPPLTASCTIPPAALFETFWESDPELLGCPTGSSIVLPQLAEELFEGGHMFWRNNPDQVYVVFDRSISSGQEFLVGNWTTDPGWTWDGSFPEGTGMETPAGRYEPVRGFGYIWRNFLNAQFGPLGWALDREYSFPNLGVIQPFENGLMFKGSAPPSYMLLNNGTFRRSQ